MFTAKQRKILEKAAEEGGVTQKMLEDIYRHRSNISTVINKMVDKGFLEEENAPNYDAARKVYFPTEAGKALAGNKAT